MSTANETLLLSIFVSQYKWNEMKWRRAMMVITAREKYVIYIYEHTALKVNSRKTLSQISNAVILTFHRFAKFTIWTKVSVRDLGCFHCLKTTNKWYGLHSQQHDNKRDWPVAACKCASIVRPVVILFIMSELSQNKSQAKSKQNKETPFVLISFDCSILLLLHGIVVRCHAIKIKIKNKFFKMR